jgi:hypothetical protein
MNLSKQVLKILVNCFKNMVKLLLFSVQAKLLKQLERHFHMLILINLRLELKDYLKKIKKE